MEEVTSLRKLIFKPYVMNVICNTSVWVESKYMFYVSSDDKYNCIKYVSQVDLIISICFSLGTIQSWVSLLSEFYILEK